MSGLADKKCVPCRGGTPPLTQQEIRPLLQEVENWEVVEQHHLQRLFSFPDFGSALEFVKRVGEIAESEDHHPDIYLAWGKVEVKTWTHKINGLSESDFVLAAKVDRVYLPGPSA